MYHCGESLDLFAYPIHNSTQANSIVFDIFAGSGSTLMACDATDRVAYCMELDPKYASVILRRYAEATGDSARITCIRGGKQLAFLDLVKDVERGKSK